MCVTEKNIIKIQAKDWSRHFSKEVTNIANECIKRYSACLVSREMQTKATMNDS